MADTHTRAAIITPIGEGGIGIVALVGPDAARVLDVVFRGTKRKAADLRPGQIAHGTIARDGRVIDEVIAADIDGRRYEVNCHGGVAAVRAVLDCLQEAGARVVGADELEPAADEESAPLAPAALSRRALALLPGAPTQLAARMLLHQAQGALTAELDTLAAELDADRPATTRSRLDGLLGSAPLGRALLDPPTVGLLGPPNVGKSTLLNALLEQERVIVHHEPGTTRDVVAERVSVRGVPFDLLDSAGIRASEDEVERVAVGRAEDLARRCDVALLLFDARDRPDGALDRLPPIAADTRLILVGNKCDLLPDAGAAEAGCDHPTVYVSARDRLNLSGLEDALLEPFGAALAACKDGGPVLFDEAAILATDAVRQALESDGCRAALSALRRFRAWAPLA